MKRQEKSLVVVLWKADAKAPPQTLLLFTNPDRGSFWQSVTGSVDKGETFAECALREAEEETGIRYARLPQYLGMEYEFDGKWGPAVERAFALWIVGGESPPPVDIDPNEHQDYAWFPVPEALEKLRHPKNKEALERAAHGASPVFLTSQGTLLQEGEEITHERTVELFHRSIAQEENGLYKIRTANGDELPLVVEDTPYFVRAYDRERGTIRLFQGEEKLAPDSLQIRGDNSLVCACSFGAPAKFLSPAYYEIMKDVELKDGEYFLQFLGQSRRLRVPS